MHPSGLALPFFLILMACGGPTPELGLNGPSTAELIWGSSHALEFTLERNEAAIGSVTLTVEGLPDGVTGRFEPAALDGDALSSTLHLEAARDAAGGVTMVTVHATADEELAATHVFPLEVKGLTVEGQVAGLNGEQLVGPLIVKVGSQRVAADAQGRFVAHQVALPYDLVVMGRMMTEVYTGLTTATPEVREFFDHTMRAPYEAIEVTGTITPTLGVNERITICTDHARPYLNHCRTFPGDGVRNTYNVTAYSSVGVSESPRVIARRQAHRAGEEPSTFTGYAEAALRADPGESEVVNLTLTPSSSTAIPFSIDGDGNPITHLSGRVSFGSSLDGATDLASDVFHLPEGAQGTIAAVAGPGPGPSALTLQPITGALEGPITFAKPVPLISPAAGVVLSDDAEFVTGAPNGVLVSHTFTVPSRALTVHTFKDRVRLSELTGYVEDLAAADITGWVATTAPQVTTPEQALAEPVGYYSSIMMFQYALHESRNIERFQMTYSGHRSFATGAAATHSVESLLGRLETTFPY